MRNPCHPEPPSLCHPTKPKDLLPCHPETKPKDLLPCHPEAKPKDLLVTALAAVIALTLGCSAFRHRSSAPEIERVQPDSVSVPSGAVVELVIRGHGFLPGTPGRNTVQFGSMSVPNVPANEGGTQIRFVVPTAMPSGGEAAPLPLESGSYAIRIQTTNGSSNAVIVRVFR